MASCRPLAVDPELSGLTALTRLLQIAGGQRAPVNTLARYAEIVERIGEAGAEMALLGLLDACMSFADALRALPAPASSGLPADVVEGLRDWITLAQRYASSPGDEVAGAALVEHLRRPCWRVSISD